MEVDSPQEDEGKKVAVHPLAIVNMSDQYTRITCGGSALANDAPVVGLLFGHSLSKDGTSTVLQILDADDIPTDRSEAAATQVSLHHAVFPLHDVVGWYRVGNSDEPTADDLRLTKELKEHYGNNKPFFFSLLQVKENVGDNSNMKDDNGNDDDDELPLNLYEVQVHDNSAVLVGVESWSLQTSEAERIAVERVVREQPQQDLKAAGTKDSAEEDASTPQPSQYVNYMTSVQSSLQAMDDRIKIIVDYLERMGKGEIPPNYSLLRQINGLVLQLGPLQQAAEPAAATSAPPDAELFAHLSAVAKTVQSVHSYTEKFRSLHENRPSGGREGRRGY